MYTRTAKQLERAEKEGLGSETQLSFLGLSRDVRIVEVTVTDLFLSP